MPVRSNSDPWYIYCPYNISMVHYPYPSFFCNIRGVIRKIDPSKTWGSSYIYLHTYRIPILGLLV